ncbi:MAG: acylphosphatase [Bacillota bacterium]
MTGPGGAVKAAHVVVDGIVQGVGFRAFARREARRLGLVGWVRNLPDGRVEVWVEGPAEAVDALVRQLERGPRGARVESVEKDHPPPAGRYTDFEVRYDAGL